MFKNQHSSRGRTDPVAPRTVSNHPVLCLQPSICVPCLSSPPDSQHLPPLPVCLLPPSLLIAQLWLSCVYSGRFWESALHENLGDIWAPCSGPSLYLQLLLCLPSGQCWNLLPVHLAQWLTTWITSVTKEIPMWLASYLVIHLYQTQARAIQHQSLIIKDFYVDKS